jgi:hypothetical protein
VILTFLVYGIVVLNLTLTFGTLFGVGIMLVIINFWLRFIDKIEFPSSSSHEERIDILSFGWNFFTSLWLLSVLGIMVYGVNGSLARFISQASGSSLGTVRNGLSWAIIFIVVLFTIPLITELALAEFLDSDSNAIDYEET